LRLTHQANGILVEQFVSAGMIEQHAHQVSDLGAATPGQGQPAKPRLNVNGLDGRKFSVSPLRDHPPAEISLVDFLGRKRTPGILSRQLVLLEVRAELSYGNGLER
jgi:hypothetical protein